MTPTRLAVVGAGAVGAYIGGKLSQLDSYEVILVDPWAEHIDAIKRNGVDIKDEGVFRPEALHIHELQGLAKDPVDIAMVSMKSYDTRWATELIAPYMKPGGFVVSAQNGFGNEEQIASIVGWPRVVGCIVSALGINADAPGHLARHGRGGGNKAGGENKAAVFRLGEAHGRITPRIRDPAEAMQVVDGSTTTTNLWGERWSKLILNSMGNGVAAIGGVPMSEIRGKETSRFLVMQLAIEAARVGRELGIDTEPVQGVDANTIAEAYSDPECYAVFEKVLVDSAARAGANNAMAISSTGRDVLKGRRTEIDGLNGVVVAKGVETAIPTPAHSALVAMVHRVERGEVPQSVSRINEVVEGLKASQS